MMRLLAKEFTKLGHTVRVLTYLPGEDSPGPVEVIRTPSALQFLKSIIWSDIILQPNLSLKLVWPGLLIGKPTVISHQQWYLGTHGAERLIDRLKRWLCRWTINICCSRAVANHLGQESRVIPNPYESEVFYEESLRPRDHSMIFVGRLVSDKGVDILVEALRHLGNRAPRCVVVGEGPELPRLRSAVTSALLSEKVIFTGSLQGHALREELNRHELLVVPSKTPEPFGIVALEGIACGCFVIGTSRGGLSDAIGPCGITVPNGDALALAQAIEESLKNRELRKEWRSKVSSHLEQHQINRIAREYANYMEQSIQ